ncbi:MAG: hypothetical protein C5B50_02435 [Verrucomicrobia bacterium]|nr:MAG: hypothetical protein C5B50_02435 [Verrucomicrobiota bacterium]
MWGLADIQYVNVTVEYSNAVLLAVLPHLSDFAARMEVPVPLPLTTAQVSLFGCGENLGDVAGAVRLTNGYRLAFQYGYFAGFKSPDSIEWLGRIPYLYGTNRMGPDEPARLCQQTIRKLGFQLEDVYADLQPTTKWQSPRTPTNTLPRCEVAWVDPRDGMQTCRFEVNTQDKKIEAIVFRLNYNLCRAPPRIAVPPIPRVGTKFKSLFQPVNPKYVAAWQPFVLSEITDYCRRLGLALSLPVTTNHVSAYICRKYEDEPYVAATLTNGCRFFYRGGMVECYDARDCFFDYLARTRVKDFTGAWRVSEQDAVQLARSAFGKLGYPLQSLGAQEKPEIERPYNVTNVPRIKLDWVKGTTEGMMLSRAVVEVDADHAKVKSIHIFNHALARSMPNLGVSPDTSEVWEQSPDPYWK